MLIKFNPLNYFNKIVDEILEPIAIEHGYMFLTYTKHKKSYEYKRREGNSTIVEKYQILSRTEGIFKKKTVSYLTFLITGELRPFIYKEIKKRKKTVLVKEDDKSIEFYFKQDKL